MSRTAVNFIQCKDGTVQKRIGKLILSETDNTEKPVLRTRKRGTWKFRPELLRMREIEKVISDRHGFGRVPDASGTDDQELCENYIRAAAFSLSNQCMHVWCRVWAPWATSELINSIEGEAGKRKKMMRADGVAGLLLVTMQERTKLGLRTIGACDMSKSERKRLAAGMKRERDKQRKAKARRSTGIKDRASYMASSIAHSKPWESVGVSRSTWYRRERETGVSRIYIHSKGDRLVSNEEIAIPPTPPKPSKLDAHCKFEREQSECSSGPGDQSPAGLQGAAPHGKG